MRKKPRETSKAEERKKRWREDALGRLGNYNLHYFNREHQETGRPVVSSAGSALREKTDTCGVEN